MKFVVKLVSIQHPGLIPTGALLNIHHPLSPPPRPPINPQFVLSFLRVSYGLAPSLSNFSFFFPSPPPMAFC